MGCRFRSGFGAVGTSNYREVRKMNLWYEMSKRDKKYRADLQLEFLLSMGETVIRVTPNNRELIKKKGRLTLFENLAEPKGGTFKAISFDEWEHKYD
jgi:hypothetical protein